jgi:hypothetical protein
MYLCKRRRRGLRGVKGRQGAGAHCWAMSTMAAASEQAAWNSRGVVCWRPKPPEQRDWASVRW